MTGFGKAEIQREGERIAIELRTLNSKQTDMYFKLPAQYKELEMEMRGTLGERLMRGKAELTVSHEGAMDKRAVINQALAAEYYAQLTQMEQSLGIEPGGADLLALIMRMPDVLQTERSELDEEHSAVMLDLLTEACDRLDEYRLQEGATLSKDLKDQITAIQGLQKEIEPFIDPRIDRIRDRIQRNLEQQMDGKDVDKSRFEQELIFYIEKYDVSEEMIRLGNHCTYFCETLNSEGATGKKLGFIAQEIGREINTLGAKSYDADMQKIVVQMKDHLEKIKEQALNVL